MCVCVCLFGEENIFFSVVSLCQKISSFFLTLQKIENVQIKPKTTTKI